MSARLENPLPPDNRQIKLNQVKLNQIKLNTERTTSGTIARMIAGIRQVTTG